MDPATATIVERAFFDIFPSDDCNKFNGAWSTYPYLPTGTILVSGIEQGLFVLRWNQNGPSTQPTEQCMSTRAPVVPPTPAPTFVPPINNRCDGAIPVAVGSTTKGTTVTAVHNADETGIYCGTTINSPGVWYRLSRGNGVVTVDTCSFANYDSKISVFEGTLCGQLRCIDGDDDGCCGFSAPSTVSWNARSGLTYYVLVHGWEDDVGLFDLSVSSQPAPDNDQCEGAIDIDASGRFSGSTEMQLWNNLSPLVGPQALAREFGIRSLESREMLPLVCVASMSIMTPRFPSAKVLAGLSRVSMAMMTDAEVSVRPV